jgi:hypothetical protein
MGTFIVPRVERWKEEGDYKVRKILWEEYAWAGTETWLMNTSGWLNKEEKVVLGTFYLKREPNQTVEEVQRVHRMDIPSLTARPTMSVDVKKKFRSTMAKALKQAFDLTSPKDFLKEELAKYLTRGNALISATFDSNAMWTDSVEAPTR